ncbi:hypothetical protein S40288_05369 [Stachybotrys chartarum IBT 40288]|nr:hypothetical protein S40288_05369 [Stachybotrys chartarum IBT 40288]
MAWGKAAGLAENESGSTLASALDASAIEVAAILSEVRTLLEAFAHLDIKHEELRLLGLQEHMLSSMERSSHAIVPDLSPLNAINSQQGKPRKAKTWHSRAKTVARTMFAVTNATKHPTRIIWQLVDEKKFDGLLLRLQQLINRLYELISQRHATELRQLTRNTYLEIVQIQESVLELKCLVAATASYPSNPRDECSGENLQSSILHDLARLKQIVSSEPVKDVEIPIRQLSYCTNKKSPSRTQGRFSSTLEGKPVQVWIEWKDQQEFVSRDPSSGLLRTSIPSSTLRRTQQLAHLLSVQKPVEFCTPTCLGYTVEPKRRNRGPRLGWVFRMPDQLGSEAVPMPLYWLLSHLPQPPLTDRVAIANKLATCILNIHAVNWLHKAIRSENILFFEHSSANDPLSPDLNNPLLAGFNVARPEDNDTSERPSAAPEKDIYRWPSIQGDEPVNGRSRKIFDIYGLGLLLLELAYWKPLHQILGFSDPLTISAHEARDIRKRLLNSEPYHVDEVLRLAGKKYHAVVKRCLQGYSMNEVDDKGLGIRSSEDETDPQVSIRLQRCYAEKVVSELGRISV